MTTKPDVTSFHQTLLWPLLLRNLHPSNRAADFLAGRLPKSRGSGRDAKQVWEEVKPEHDDKAVIHDQPYEEVLYFHPFVRDFLYGDGRTPSAKRPMRRFRRCDIDQVQLDWTEIVRDDKGRETESPVTVPLRVRRIELYVFSTGVMVLVVEVGTAEEKTLPLDHALTIQQQFRHAYPGFWKGEKPGKCLDSVTWSCNDKPLTRCGTDSRQQSYDFTAKGAEPPVSFHFCQLRHPLQPFDGRTSKELTYQQIVDNRMPSMSFFGVTDPRQIAESDMERLASLDGPGNGFAYAKDFIDHSDARTFYDRFWCDDPKDGKQWQSTRYAISGYAFVMIGDGRQDTTGENAGTNVEFTNEAFGMLSHFRQHYFKLCLIAHYQRASLLMFAHRLAEATAKRKERMDGTERHRADVDKQFRISIQSIQRDFELFRSKYWFTDVSNQLQGQELFDLLIAQLKTESFFDQVMDELDRLNNSLMMTAQDRTADMQTGLAILGTVIAVLQTVDLFIQWAK